jgi:hypothetical protein
MWWRGGGGLRCRWRKGGRQLGRVWGVGAWGGIKARGCWDGASGGGCGASVVRDRTFGGGCGGRGEAGGGRGIGEVGGARRFRIGWRVRFERFVVTWTMWGQGADGRHVRMRQQDQGSQGAATRKRRMTGVSTRSRAKNGAKWRVAHKKTKQNCSKGALAQAQRVVLHGGT